jgi:hypothetical protein
MPHAVAGLSADKPMSNTLPATAGKGVVARLIGLVTLLWGGVYAAVGARLLLVWADLLPLQNNDLADRIIIERNLACLALLGVLFFVLGMMALAAAWGLFARKPWGRILTLITAVLAIAVGLCFPAMVPPGRDGRDAAEVSLAAAPVLYGVLAFAVLGRNRAEPVGIYILRLMSILLGLPVVVYLGFSLPEFAPGFFHQEGTSRGDVGSRFLALAVPSGLVAGLLIVATGVVLLILVGSALRPSSR